MGTRRATALVDTTPAKTILVFRNGDPFFEGRKVVLARRRVPTFEALLEQLTEQVAAPFGVRRLYTPTHGRPVRGLDALLPGGKYVAAGPERFKKLDYIHIVPRKPAKMKKLKEVSVHCQLLRMDELDDLIRPVVHCDLNVPSRWQTFHQLFRRISVFTNGKLLLPPVQVIIPKARLAEWESVLATINEKVFPLGGVRRLFTMNGHLLDNAKDLRDKHFYVAAGLETFKSLPYCECPGAAAAQQKYTDSEKNSQKKKKEDAQGGGAHEHGHVPLKAHESVFYAKKGKKKTPVKPLVHSRAEGDVYKAQAPHLETQGASEVTEDQDVRVEVPEDQDDGSRTSSKKRVPLRHSTKGKASLKKGGKMKDVVLFPEKEPNDFLDEESTPALLKPPVKADHREPPMGQQSQESSLRPPEGEPEEEESLEQSSQEQILEEQQSLEQSSFIQTSREQIPDGEGTPDQPSLGQPSQEQLPDGEGPPDQQPSLGQPSQEQILEEQQSLEQSSFIQTSQEQIPDGEGPPDQPSLGQPSQEQESEEEESLEQSSWVQTSQEQVRDGEGPPDQPSLGKPSPKQMTREEQTEEQIP